MLVVEIATLSRSGLLGLGVGALVLRAALPRLPAVARADRAGRWARSRCSRSWSSTRLHFFLVVIRSRIQTGRASQSAHFQVYSFIPQILHSHPLLGLGLNNFSIYYQAVTGKTNWGPHSFYVSLIVETGIVGTVLFALLPVLGVRAARRRARTSATALARAGDPLAARVRAARLGLDGGARRDAGRERLLPDDAFYYFFVFLALALAVPLVFGACGRSAEPRPRRAAPRGRPRPRRAARARLSLARLRPHDVVPALARRRRRRVRRRAGRGAPRGRRRGRRRLAGRLPPLRDRLRRRDRPEPAGAARGSSRALPLFLVARSRWRRGGRLADADVVHAHWLPSALAGARDRASRSCCRSGAPTSSSPAARRGSPRPLLRRARVVVAASPFLADGAARARRARGAGDPERRRDPRRGRRARRAAARALRRPAERGEGDPRVPRGDRGAAARRSSATGRFATGCPRRSASSPHGRARRLLRARRGRLRSLAARGLRRRRPRGDGLRPPGRRDRASAGSRDAVEDGETGLLVRPRDAPALREAVERLLGDEALRARLGAAGAREGRARPRAPMSRPRR